ncbi:MAG: hypothetical protein KQH83_01945 [Actinobacteria bacterium]|nr:hypothetical protein [Actinomycetota bacterium]
MSEATFGDVTGEYLALRDGAGLVAAAHDVVRVAGPDAVSFLDGLLTQDVAGPVGSVARAMLLEPRGKVAELLWMLRGDGEVLLAADPGRGPSLAGALERYRFRVEAAIEHGPPGVEVWGPGAAGVLESAGLPAPDGWAGVDGATVAALPLGGLPRFLVAGGDAAALESAGARPAGTVAATTVRIEAGEPHTGVDVDGGVIPQETGLVPDAVSFTKGCFLGQELVARIDTRGRVNRHLRGVTLHDAVIPPEGAEVAAGGVEVGVVTSVGESLAMRAPVALGLLRREAEPGMAAHVRWTGGSAAATVRELPLDDFAGR